ncbi:N-acetyltransferase [Thomasclavelia cocleata]|uniref:Acetyltransferase (GNAT) domain-containing protein n=2 Tax=Thomasclavelia cocleata TaxID=69824 RepID=A0A1I0ENF0_9FIRM|nr:GNAT family N-acetyltransferase [Thomasclavelia cocleata]MCR1961223.1 GNAT family N-acetyltransferase [Thomasclavelia cocleata]NDO41628.1 GNAT family N-acetyltransferase [Thomasclavelia cocleata]PJN80765.1 N-acetyltransferase [Thomasclavelia cocleata]SET46086.1 Acetyltransferase (GNAT) domain-containing protein [Thomasclavelia cocleata]
MIREIKNKMDFDLLLTESDPNINLVRDYLEHGTLYGYYINNEPVSFIAVEIINGEVEIKNILTLVEYRRHGYAKALIKFIESTYNTYDTFLIGTANSSFENITFYTRLGYIYSHRIENFFLDYYPKEIIENGIQATDLIYFKKSKNGLN